MCAGLCKLFVITHFPCIAIYTYRVVIFLRTHPHASAVSYLMAEGEKLYSLHQSTETSLAYSDLDQMHAYINWRIIHGKQHI